MIVSKLKNVWYSEKGQFLESDLSSDSIPRWSTLRISLVALWVLESSPINRNMYELKLQYRWVTGKYFSVSHRAQICNKVNHTSFWKQIPYWPVQPTAIRKKSLWSWRLQTLQTLTCGHKDNFYSKIMCKRWVVHLVFLVTDPQCQYSIMQYHFKYEGTNIHVYPLIIDNKRYKCSLKIFFFSPEVTLWSFLCLLWIRVQTCTLSE